MKKGNIVIIDNDTTYAAWLQKYLMETYFKEQITLLNKYDATYFKENQVDLLFLDIELENQNGIEKAIEIREQYGFTMEIIFVSHHSYLIQTSLKAGPVHFIRKGFEERDMAIAMSSLSLRNFRKQVLLEVGEESLPIGTIQYIETKGHDVVFHTIEQTVRVSRSKLDTWQEKLEKHHFIRCHTSYLVNASYIEERKREYVVLTDGTKMNITRKYTVYFKTKYLDYIRYAYA